MTIRSLIFCIFLLFVLSFLSGCLQYDTSLCNDKVIFVGEEKLSFGKNEKLLLCGDTNEHAWDDVPLAQTEIVLREILKGKAHFDAFFWLENQTLYVNPGPIAKVQKIDYYNAPYDFHKEKLVGWKGQDFTSKTLNLIQDWVLRRLKSMGYACARVEIQAIIETGVVEVIMVVGEKYNFPDIQYQRSMLSELHPGVLQRFYAFKPGEVYNANLLELSAQRTKNEGIVAYTSFATECDQGKINVFQKVSLGTSHIFKMALGMSTEEIPIARFSWKNSRVGERGSSIFATLYGSNLRQELTLGFDWHPFEENRWFIKPSLSGNRIRESDQAYIESSLYVPSGRTIDLKNTELYIAAGPSYLLQKVSEGSRTGRRDFGLWKNTLQWTSHDFEFHGTDPRNGYQLRLDTTSILYATSQQIQAHSISIQGTKLWNVFHLAPPQYVLGLRFGLDFVLGWGDDIRQNIPQDYFNWLGGDQNVRGFSRRELPDKSHQDGEAGALSTLFGGIELRFNDKWVRGLDPFVFFDVGMIGKENIAFDSTLYTSPGLGARYESPLGVLRGTVAHGIVIGSQNPGHEHLQFFLSLGSEF